MPLRDPRAVREDAAAAPMGFNQLPPDLLPAFMRWYQQIAVRRGLVPDPFDPQHHYDYVAAYLSGAAPTANPDPTQNGHLASSFKMAGYPNRFVTQQGGTLLDTKTEEQLGQLRQPQIDPTFRFRAPTPFHIAGPQTGHLTDPSPDTTLKLLDLAHNQRQGDLRLLKVNPQEAR